MVGQAIEAEEGGNEGDGNKSRPNFGFWTARLSLDFGQRTVWVFWIDSPNSLVLGNLPAL
jgi:hypothetical protein